MRTLFILLFFHFTIPIFCQDLPVIKASSKEVKIKDGTIIKENYWVIFPETKPDVYFVELPKKEHSVKFITDQDSITFDVRYGLNYDFIILLNGKDSCYTRISATYPKEIIPINEVTIDTIPFTLRDNRIYIRGRINDTENLNFQFDLGAGGLGMIFINHKTIKKSEIYFDKNTTLLNSHGSNETRMSSNNNIQIGKNIWQSIEIVETKNMKNYEDAIFGSGLFHNKYIEVDYDTKLMILHSKKPFINDQYSKHLIRLNQNVCPELMVDFEFDGKRYSDWFGFDTGNTGNGIINNHFLKNNDLYKRFSKFFSFGNRTIAKLPIIHIGNHRFKDGIIVLERTNKESSIGQGGGILGNKILKKFNFILDLQEGYIYLKPNSYYMKEKNSWNIINVIYVCGLFILFYILNFQYSWVSKIKKWKRKDSGSNFKSTALKRCHVFAYTFFMVSSFDAMSQIPLDSINAIIQKEVNNKRSKSIIVGIVDSNGRRILSAGVKSDTDPIAPDVNTMYETGSIGKLFTALTMAEMSRREDLNYNDPISKYLPSGVKSPTKNGKEISLLHLSTHRSGLPRMQYNLDPSNLDDPFADYNTKQLYDYISGVEFNRDINSKWQYSNIGYGLLGHILTLVSKKDFASTVKKYVFKKLKMKNSGVSYSSNKYLNTAIGHSEYGRPISGWSGGNQTLAGAGVFSSNMTDLLNFAEANLGLRKSSLDPAIDLTHINQGKKDGNDGFVTMGWTIMSEDQQNILWKDGGTFGYRTFIGIDKINKYGIVILSNTDNPITDIGLHVLDPSNNINPYSYNWHLVDTLYSTIISDGIDKGITQYQKIHLEKSEGFNFDPKQLSHLGNELRRKHKIAEAIKIFELNATEYPKIPIVYENLAEIHKRFGDKNKADYYFKKLLELEPNNQRWVYLLNRLNNK